MFCPHSHGVGIVSYNPCISVMTNAAGRHQLTFPVPWNKQVDVLKCGKCRLCHFRTENEELKVGEKLGEGGGLKE